VLILPSMHAAQAGLPAEGEQAEEEVETELQQEPEPGGAPPDRFQVPVQHQPEFILILEPCVPSRQLTYAAMP